MEEETALRFVVEGGCRARRVERNFASSIYMIILAERASWRLFPLKRERTRRRRLFTRRDPVSVLYTGEKERERKVKAKSGSNDVFRWIKGNGFE